MGTAIDLSSLEGSHVITDIVIDELANSESGELIITLASGYKVVVGDYGQDCCESRYLTTSDNLKTLLGESLISIRVTDTVYDEGSYGDVHEIQFLEVSTDRDSVTIETHNEHNGYYGGFSIGTTIIPPSRGLK